MKQKLFIASLLGLTVIASPAAFADHHKGDGKEKSAHHMKADTNNDGVIDKAEFMAMKAERFDEMDTNNDGTLSREEMRSARQKFHKKHQEMKQKRQETRGEKKGNLDE